MRLDDLYPLNVSENDGRFVNIDSQYYLKKYVGQGLASISGHQESGWVYPGFGTKIICQLNSKNGAPVPPHPFPTKGIGIPQAQNRNKTTRILIFQLHCSGKPGRTLDTATAQILRSC